MAVRLAPLLARLPARLRRLVADERGVSAVEFAMVLPLMALMYVGTVEVTNAVAANRKLVAATSAIGDLTGQAQDVLNADMNNIFDATAAVMNPFATGALQLRISQIQIDGAGRATVAWSDGRNMTALTRGASYSGLPAGVRVANTYVIVSEASYAYASPLGSFITGTIAMRETFYLRPRIGDCVRRNGSCT
jgi:Flp pilus assembly protein TadG